MSGIVLDATGQPVGGEARQIAVLPTTAIIENPYSAPLASFLNMLADPKISADEMNARLSVLERMMALEKAFEERQIEREKRDAEKAFHQALAQAKGEIPPIKRTKNVKFKSKDPNKAETNYWHEELGEIGRICVPILAKYGLHYDFLVEQGIPNKPVSVQCVLHHCLGHSVTGLAAFGPPDTSGNKNTMQQSESTVSYLKRSTVKAALGLSVGDVDDDGRASEQQPDEPKITAEQVAEIDRLIAALPRSHITNDTAGLCRQLRIETVEDLPASQYQDCVDRIATAKAKREEAIAADKARQADTDKIKQDADRAAAPGSKQRTMI